jgi:phosphodiesterase/alkaline phosphatase D-like protein
MTNADEKKTDNNRKLILIINGREKDWNKGQISFEEAVILAFGAYDNNPNRVYTVTYDRGAHQNPEGLMVYGDTVYVKNKMIFNVTATDKS